MNAEEIKQRDELRGGQLGETGSAALGIAGTIGGGEETEAGPLYAFGRKTDETGLSRQPYELAAMLHAQLAMQPTAHGGNGRRAEGQLAGRFHVVATITNDAKHDLLESSQEPKQA